MVDKYNELCSCMKDPQKNISKIKNIIKEIDELIIKKYNLEEKKYVLQETRELQDKLELLKSINENFEEDGFHAIPLFFSDLKTKITNYLEEYYIGNVSNFKIIGTDNCQVEVRFPTTVFFGYKKEETLERTKDNLKKIGFECEFIETNIGYEIYFPGSLQNVDTVKKILKPLDIGNLCLRYDEGKLCVYSFVTSIKKALTLPVKTEEELFDTYKEFFTEHTLKDFEYCVVHLVKSSLSKDENLKDTLKYMCKISKMLEIKTITANIYETYKNQKNSLFDEIFKTNNELNSKVSKIGIKDTVYNMALEKSKKLDTIFKLYPDSSFSNDYKYINFNFMLTRPIDIKSNEYIELKETFDTMVKNKNGINMLYILDTQRNKELLINILRDIFGNNSDIKIGSRITKSDKMVIEYIDARMYSLLIDDFEN